MDATLGTEAENPPGRVELIQRSDLSRFPKESTAQWHVS